MNEKVLFDILSGTKDANIKFKDLQSVLISLGFACRVKGDHFIKILIYRSELIFNH